MKPIKAAPRNTYGGGQYKKCSAFRADFYAPPPIHSYFRRHWYYLGSTL